MKAENTPKFVARYAKVSPVASSDDNGVYEDAIAYQNALLAEKFIGLRVKIFLPQYQTNGHRPFEPLPAVYTPMFETMGNFERQPDDQRKVFHSTMERVDMSQLIEPGRGHNIPQQPVEPREAEYIHGTVLTIPTQQGFVSSVLIELDNNLGFCTMNVDALKPL